MEDTNSDNPGKHKLDEEAENQERKKKARQDKTAEHKQRRTEKKAQKKEKVRESGDVVTQAQIKETTYSIDKDYRRVVPYDFTFQVSVKGRWVGRPILEVFSQEFSRLSGKDYETKIKRGDITIDGNLVQPNTLLRLHNHVTHKVHRHEPPVVPGPIQIIYASDEVVVVDKPSSIPVHPCGMYRHNSVLFILAHEQGLTGLCGIHRLDRLTSGLLILARNAKAAKTYGEQISSRQVQKQYVAKVVGKFPSTEVVVDEPIKVVNKRIGVNVVDPTGKPSKTTFNLHKYDEKSNMSVVFCKPLTGRTHQIRVHLKHLGFPIANDPIYNDDPAVNKLAAMEAKGGNFEDGEAGDLGETGDSSEPFDSGKAGDAMETGNAGGSTEAEKSGDSVEAENSEAPATPSGALPPPVVCKDCLHPKPDPPPKEMCLYLHAYSYEGPEWKFETPLPKWAEHE